MFRRQPDFRDWLYQRFFQPNSQSVLVTACDQGRTRGGTNRGVRIGLQEAQTGRGDSINVGGLEIGSAITGDIGVAKIVSKDEQNVGRFCALLTE